MEGVLLISGGRPMPQELGAFCQRSGFAPESVSAAAVTAQHLAREAFAVIVTVPAWSGHAYLATGRLWYDYLLDNAPNVRLVFAGYQSVEHNNYLDLLLLPEYNTQWWDTLQPVSEMTQVPSFNGIDLHQRLDRFFAGHGNDSVIAALTRIRMVIQMAGRELEKMDTPYGEIFTELVAPARLSNKWADWRSRWLNYYPLFKHTPCAFLLDKVAVLMDSLDDWMLQDGVEEELLRNGTVLNALNEARAYLQTLENQYVSTKLQHTHR